MNFLDCIPEDIMYNYIIPSLGSYIGILCYVNINLYKYFKNKVPKLKIKNFVNSIESIKWAYYNNCI